MRNEIIVFLRLASFYVGFTLIMTLPSYGYGLLTFSGSASVIYNIYAHILYYTVLMLVIWFLAPWLSRKIFMYIPLKKIQFTMHMDAILRVGLILIGIRYVFEKSTILISYFLTKDFLTGNHLIAQKGNVFTDFLHSQTAVSATISFMLAVVFIVNHKKAVNFLTAKL